MFAIFRKLWKDQIYKSWAEKKDKNSVLTLSIKSEQKIFQVLEKSCLSGYKSLIDGQKKKKTPCQITVKTLSIQNKESLLKATVEKP